MALPVPLINLGLILAAGFFGALLARLFKLPVLLGYLFGGIVVGALTEGTLTSDTILQGLSQFGVAMLIFSVGVEISFTSFQESGLVITLLALLQVLFTMAAVLAIAPLFAIPFPAALFFGAAISISSTAVAVKILEGSGHLGTVVGQTAIGWSLVQDLMVIPFFFLLPLLSGGHFDLTVVAILIAKTCLVLLFVAVLGRRLGRFVLDLLARSDSVEVLLLGLVIWIIFAAAVSISLGLSLTLGAFLAGVTLGGTSHETFILSLTRPIRDLFAAIFFTSLGLFLPPHDLLSLLLPTIIIGTAILILKFTISTVLLLFFKYHLRLAVDVSAPIAGVGEFAFLIISLGLSLGLVGHNLFSLTVSLVLFSIAATPAFTWAVGRLFPLAHSQTLSPKHADLSAHVVICGFGRVGFWVGEALKRQGLSTVAVDYHHLALKTAHDLAIPVVYGDATLPEVLNAAALSKARAVVVTVPDIKNQERILSLIKYVNPAAYVVARAHRQSDSARLIAAGAHVVIQPEFEASLSIIHRLLQEVGVTREDVAQTVRAIRADARAFSTL